MVFKALSQMFISLATLIPVSHILRRMLVNGLVKRKRPRGSAGDWKWFLKSINGRVSVCVSGSRGK